MSRTIRRDCGSCNKCCTLLAVMDIGKPAGMTCWWTGVHGGCQRHAEKQTDPTLAACAQWACLWLESQAAPQDRMVMDRMLRPDMSKVVLFRDSKDEGKLWAQVDPSYPNAFREKPIGDYLDGFLSRGGRLEVVIGEQHLKFPENQP